MFNIEFRVHDAMDFLLNWLNFRENVLTKSAILFAIFVCVCFSSLFLKIDLNLGSC